MKSALPWLGVLAAVLLMLDCKPPSYLYGGSSAAAGGASSVAESGLQVVEMSVDDIPVVCRDPESCTDDYLGFIERAAGKGGPAMDLAALLTVLQEMEEGEGGMVYSRPAAQDELRAVILEQAHIGFLLDGLDERELLVVERSNVPDGPIQQIRLAFEDPWVGVFEALLMLPSGEGPWPAVIVHPGHSQTPLQWRESQGGSMALPDAGIALLILQPRANASDEHESEVTTRLLLGGFTMVGLRMYETLLLHKYLRWRPDIDGEKLGLLGHSGGSAVGNLVTRVEPRWAGYVSDMMATYATRMEEGMLLDETAPGLFSWHELISDFSTSPVTTLEQEYAYPDGPGEFVAFFEERLLGRGGGEDGGEEGGTEP